jgi:hypothetical protein
MSFRNVGKHATTEHHIRPDRNRPKLHSSGNIRNTTEQCASLWLAFEWFDERPTDSPFEATMTHSGKTTLWSRSRHTNCATHSPNVKSHLTLKKLFKYPWIVSTGSDERKWDAVIHEAISVFAFILTVRTPRTLSINLSYLEISYVEVYMHGVQEMREEISDTEINRKLETRVCVTHASK